MNEITLFDKTTPETGISGLGNSTMAKDEFLKLLVEQLKHQDPMSPMNSQDFASQLAQFSSLEQLTNMSGMMEESIQVDLMLTQAINNTMSASFIGKNVSAAGDTITFSKDGPVDISFQLNGQAENVIVIDPEAYLNATSTQVDYLSFFADFHHPKTRFCGF